MNILISGGRGFIGSALAERLKGLGHSVDTYDLVDGQDLLNREQLDKAVAGRDLVYHLAAVADLNWARVHPHETMQINVEACWNVAESCVKHQAKLFYASTCCVYGNQEIHPVTEKTLPNPAEIYACSKLAGEQVIRGFGLMYNLPYNFMRFATIYGPGLRPALGVHIFLGQALRGEPITVHGRGEQTRTLTFIDDLIDGIIAIQNSGIENESWNLTAEREVSAMDMAKVAKEITASDAPIVFVPQRPGQTFKEQVSAQKMKGKTGWMAKTSFEYGMRKTLEWFKATNQMDHKYEEPK